MGEAGGWTGVAASDEGTETRQQQARPAGQQKIDTDYCGGINSGTGVSHDKSHRTCGAG